MDFAIGAAAAMTATVFSNPLEVVKTRFQLQGELKVKGQYAVHYRGFFHAFYIIAKTDGLLALQKGLIPALWHQLFMNGIRLGGVQLAEKAGYTQKADGKVSLSKLALIAAFFGGLTAYTGSPFYLVKIQLQSQSSDMIAVGHQHKIKGLFHGLTTIYSTHGIVGLWRGCSGSLPRRCIGSATQLTSFTFCKDYLANNKYYEMEKGYLNSFTASMIGGILTTIVMNPLDCISTRLYNQGVDRSGKGLLYSSYMDCVGKMYKTEGLRGFYKGIVPMYIRTGPHNVLVLVLWDTFKDLQKKFYDDSPVASKL